MMEILRMEKKQRGKPDYSVREKKLMESFPGKELAERRFGAVTEESNSSLTLILFRKAGSYKLFLNGEVCIIGIFYFLLRKRKRLQFGSNSSGQIDKKYLSGLCYLCLYSVPLLGFINAKSML